MTIDHLLNIPCTITHIAHTGTPDVYGNPTEESTTSESTCWGYQTYRTDADVADRSRAGKLTHTETERWTYEFPSTAILYANDTVLIGDDPNPFQVAGPPWRATNPRSGSEAFVVAFLERTV